MHDAESLHRSCWSEWPIEVVREVLQRVELTAARGRGEGVVAVASPRGGVLGYGQITIWPRAAEISDLIVTPAYRRMGIGSAIIRTLVDKARSWRLPRVEIGVAQSNPRALALYRRLGFQEDRMVDIDLGKGPEKVIYLTIPLAEGKQDEGTPENAWLPS